MMNKNGQKTIAVFALVLLLSVLMVFHTTTLSSPGKVSAAVSFHDGGGAADSVPALTRVFDQQNSILVGNYWEKMTMAMNSMFQLATIAKMWNATIPIPFTTDSKLYGLPDGGLNLDITFIYDFRKLMYMCRAKQFNITMFSTFEEFILSASRNVIGIELKYGRTLQAPVPSHHIYDVDCHKDISSSLLNRLNREASVRSLKPFHFVKCCHILAGHDTSPQEISKLCGIHDQGRVTILIKQWRGLENHARFRLYMKKFAVPYPGPRTPLPHSRSIIHSSNRLLLSKLPNLHTKFIGVHLRSEKVMLRNTNTAIYDYCFQLFYNLAQNLSTHYGLPVLYLGDWATRRVFGTNMLKHKLLLTEYHKTHDSGYNAQVEQAVLGRAEVLILVGGGSFEVQVYNRFRTYKNSGIAYRVCAEESARDKYLTTSLVEDVVL